MMWFLIPVRFRSQVFIFAAVLFFGGYFWMGSMGLRTAEAPNGILDIELAGTTTRATEVIGSWQKKFGGSLNPAFDDLLIDDLLFIPSYTTGLGLLCLWARSVLGGNRGRDASEAAYKAGTLLAWGQIVTAALDYTENQTIRVMLRGPIADPWPQITAGLASVKLGLVVVGLLFSLLGLLAWFVPHLISAASQVLARASQIVAHTKADH